MKRHNEIEDCWLLMNPWEGADLQALLVELLDELVRQEEMLKAQDVAFKALVEVVRGPDLGAKTEGEP